MAIAVTFSADQPEALTRGMIWKGTIVLSSGYTTGGESLAAAFPAAGTSKKPHDILVQDTSGYFFRYDRANNKLLIFTAAATELSQAGYPGGLTTDVITFTAFGSHLD